MKAIEEVLSMLKNDSYRAWVTYGPRHKKWTVERVRKHLRDHTGEDVAPSIVEKYLRSRGAPVRYAADSDVKIPPPKMSAVKPNKTRGRGAGRSAAQKGRTSRPKASSPKKMRLKKNVLIALTGANDIAAAYRVLAQRLRQGGRNFLRTVGWPSGNRRVTVFWHEQHRFWVALSPTINRNHYWLGFGLQNPRKHPHTLNITCEVNPPRKGVNRRCAGILLRDSGGSIFLGHSGKVGGGRKGIGKNSFLENYRGKTQQVTWTTETKNTTANAVVLGRIDGPELSLNLAKFIVDVDSFKESVGGTPDTSALLSSEAAKAESEGRFNPESLRDGRKWMLANIVSRRGQQGFRKKLLREYGGRCAVTGCNCADALEAAHIRPYLGEETHHITNGLLLRSDLHTLFDLQKVSVSAKYTLEVSNELKNTVYGKLQGKRLWVPRNLARRPNRKVLAEHRAGMK